MIQLPTHYVIFLEPVHTLIADVEMEGHTPLSDNQPSKEQSSREQKVRFNRGGSEQAVQDRTTEK